MYITPVPSVVRCPCVTNVYLEIGILRPNEPSLSLSAGVTQEFYGLGNTGFRNGTLEKLQVVTMKPAE